MTAGDTIYRGAGAMNVDAITRALAGPRRAAMTARNSPRRQTIETDTRETCKCGTNEHLVVTGISAVFEISGKLAWSVECFGCGERYLIGDEARDALFGTGWRKP